MQSYKSPMNSSIITKKTPPRQKKNKEITMSIHSANTEILQIADAVAREKGIGRDAVLAAMEMGIQITSRRKYGHELVIQAHIDRKTGETTIMRIREVMEDDQIEDDRRQITLSDAKERKADIAVGDVITDALPPLDKSWVGAQSAKQIITNEVRNAVREREYEDFKDRVGEVINGIVKRVEHNVIVDLGRAEAILPRNSMIRGETLKQNDRVRAYIENVTRDTKGPQIILSRTHNQFLAKLFAQEVPEIYDGVIEVIGVAREPGSRAKMAVYSKDSSIDPVGSCVGIRGSRVQAVIAELQGEKIDIIPWSADTASFVIRALAPAEATKVVIDEERRRIEVIVAPEQQSLAIGRRGQNVRLASQLTGWNIDILTDTQESERREEEVQGTSALFIRALDVDETLASLLAMEGFTSVRDFVDITLEELASIEGFDLELAEAIRERAEQYLAKNTSFSEAQLKQMHMEAAIATLPDMTDTLMLLLSQKGLHKVMDIADLSNDEWQEMMPESGLSEAEVNRIIMAARDIAYTDESDEDQ
jgi:N utilization substance protein A